MTNYADEIQVYIEWSKICQKTQKSIKMGIKSGTKIVNSESKIEK